MGTAEFTLQQHVENLYVDHHGWLRAWLRRRLGDSFIAADLTHDTFLRVLGRREIVDLREPRAYLTTIAHGLVVNHWRRQEIENAYLETLATSPEATSPSPETRALLVEALCELDALLDRLNPKARSAFLLAQLDGLTYGEIAARLQVSERMVKKYMAQAMLHCLTSGLQPDTLLVK
ncbi:MAG: sigma-70 family RNA polymerase sigma factor [Lautropia sp.]